MNLNCPQCGSEHTQKLTAIVSGGTQFNQSTTHATSMGTVGGQAGIANTAATTNSVSTTNLAGRLAPPRMQRYHGVVDLLVIAGLVAFAAAWVTANVLHGYHLEDWTESKIMFGAAVVAFCGAFRFFDKSGAKSRKWNAEVFPGLYAKWEKQFYCHRCEFVYIPLDPKIREQLQRHVDGVSKSLNEMQQELFAVVDKKFEAAKAERK